MKQLKKELTSVVDELAKRAHELHGIESKFKESDTECARLKATLKLTKKQLKQVSETRKALKREMKGLLKSVRKLTSKQERLDKKLSKSEAASAKRQTASKRAVKLDPNATKKTKQGA